MDGWMEGEMDGWMNGWMEEGREGGREGKHISPCARLRTQRRRGARGRSTHVASY